MEIVTYAQLNADIINNLYKIPEDIDLIVGVPRSGMLVAEFIGLYLNKPVTDLQNFINKRITNVGNTKNKKGMIHSFDEVKKVLIVEDSIDAGTSIINVKKEIEESILNIKILYLAAYIRTGKEDLVDFFYRKIDDTRVFEWNYLHNRLLERACVDIDGVLCFDPTPEENDDGEEYRKFLLNAKAKLKPTRKIGYIVTSRLEKYRKETEQWLRKNEIDYDHLIMMNVGSAEERRQLGNHAQFKANVFKNTRDAIWFIESEMGQAEEIARISKKCVFCTENQQAYNEYSIHHEIYVKNRKLKQKIKSLIKKVLPSKVVNKIRGDKV